MSSHHDPGAVHALGNGRLIAYARGADLTHLLGPVYSSASLLAAAWSVPADRPLTAGPAGVVRTRRHPGAAIWTTELAGPDLVTTASVTATVDPEHDVLLWQVEASAPVVLRLRASRPGRWTLEDRGMPGGQDVVLTTVGGAPVFVYPDPAAPVAVLRVVDASGSVVMDDEHVMITLAPGHHDVLLTVGEDLTAAGWNLDAVGAPGTFDAVLDRRRRHDEPIVRAVAGHAERWHAVPGWGEQAAGRLEGAVLSMVAQQSADGGLLAGYPYPLAYGRDQYGACRGLAAVGLIEQSRRNFWFRHEKLRRFGRLANAESMGHDRVRHLHENDDVELTSYHVLHAVELAEDPRSGVTLEPLLADLVDCLRVQLPHLRADVLPFNGDETYVAGGILPRSTLEDGSLESTLLFCEAARRLRPWADASGHDAPAVWAAAEQLSGTWRERFGWAPGIGGWATNAPVRRHEPPLRQARRGVCESCGQIGHDLKRRTERGRFVCDTCRSDGHGDRLPAVSDERYSLLSASLLPFLLDQSLLGPDERERVRSDALASFDAVGQLRTLATNPKAVGYDAALLLLAVAAGDRAQRDRAAHYLLARFDEADTLAEYYLEGAPSGTRCRPWETGVALAALAAAAAGAMSELSGRDRRPARGS